MISPQAPVGAAPPAQITALAALRWAHAPFPCGVRMLVAAPLPPLPSAAGSTMRPPPDGLVEARTGTATFTARSPSSSAWTSAPFGGQKSEGDTTLHVVQAASGLGSVGDQRVRRRPIAPATRSTKPRSATLPPAIRPPGHGRPSGPHFQCLRCICRKLMRQSAEGHRTRPSWRRSRLARARAASSPSFMQGARNRSMLSTRKVGRHVPQDSPVG